MDTQTHHRYGDEHLGERGREITADSFIMTGGVTEAIAVAAGDNVTVRFQALGSVSMRFVA